MVQNGHFQNSLHNKYEVSDWKSIQVQYKMQNTVFHLETVECQIGLGWIEKKKKKGEPQNVRDPSEPFICANGRVAAI